DSAMSAHVPYTTLFRSSESLCHLRVLLLVGLFQLSDLGLQCSGRAFELLQTSDLSVTFFEGVGYLIEPRFRNVVPRECGLVSRRSEEHTSELESRFDVV